MATVLGAFTYEDLEKMPDDGRRYELLNGEIVMSPSPSWAHQELVFRLAALLRAFVQDRAGGVVLLAPFEIRLPGPSALQPDVLAFSAERRHLMRRNHAVGAPDLVVEVLSPSTRDRDEGEKLAIYLAAGVHEYWLVDPEAGALRALALDGARARPLPVDGNRVASAAFPGLTVDVSGLFGDLP